MWVSPELFESSSFIGMWRAHTTATAFSLVPQELNNLESRPIGVKHGSFLFKVLLKILNVLLTDPKNAQKIERL